jgi:hypothetical protein
MYEFCVGYDACLDFLEMYNQDSELNLFYYSLYEVYKPYFIIFFIELKNQSYFIIVQKNNFVLVNCSTIDIESYIKLIIVLNFCKLNFFARP